MDSLTLFGHLFKTRCEAICIFLDFFTEKRGSHRGIYDFFRKSHETHCIRRKFSIYCNKNCSGDMQILCPFAETTYTPSGDENRRSVVRTTCAIEKQLTPRQGTKTCTLQAPSVLRCETTYAPSGDENSNLATFSSVAFETTYAPSGDENTIVMKKFPEKWETTYAPPGDENPDVCKVQQIAA